MFIVIVFCYVNILFFLTLPPTNIKFCVSQSPKKEQFLPYVATTKLLTDISGVPVKKSKNELRMSCAKLIKAYQSFLLAVVINNTGEQNKTSTKFMHRCVISTKVNKGEQRQTKANKVEGC